MISRARLVVVFSFAVFFAAFFARPAAAYPTLIRHGYASCQACHVDPSGAGQLTPYGRAQSDLLVGWHFDPASMNMEEPAPTTGFLFGLVPLPELLNLSGNVRGGGLYNTTTTGQGAGLRPLLMAADVSAAVDADWFIAHASVGFGLRNVGPAVVISKDAGPDLALVSREHWVGAQLLDDSLTVRAGRIPLPFGLRNNEHTSLVRALTRTDIDTQAQHGIAASWNAETWRAEVMGIAGNFQIHPDVFRERGYSGFAEWSPTKELALGASSLLTYAQKDIDVQVPLLRQAHGVFGRWAATPWLVVLGEADAIIGNVDADAWAAGGAGWLSVDVEPVQGIHITPSFEAAQLDENSALPTMGGWLTATWYPLPHTELRADTIYTQTSPKGADSFGTFTALLQLHLFL